MYNFCILILIFCFFMFILRFGYFICFSCSLLKFILFNIVVYNLYKVFIFFLYIVIVFVLGRFIRKKNCKFLSNWFKYIFLIFLFIWFMIDWIRLFCFFFNCLGVEEGVKSLIFLNMFFWLILFRKFYSFLNGCCCFY